MKTDYFPLIILAVLVPLIISPVSVTAIDLNDEKVKVVVQFEIDKNPNSVRGDYTTQSKPIIQSLFDDLGTNYFNVTQTGQDRNPYNYDAKFKLADIHQHGTNPMGDGIYQIYPLIRIVGNNPNLSEADYDLQHDIIVAQMRLAIVDMLQQEGAYNVETYLHFSFGGVHFNEGF